MTTAQGALQRLAAAAGVASRYRDARGRERRVPERTICAVLAAMGIPAATAREVAESTARLEARAWHEVLPAAVTLVAEEGLAPVTLAARDAARSLEWA